MVFSLWVADIPQPPKTVDLSQFADDIASWANGKDHMTARDKLQKYNNRIIAWCAAWNILLSARKTQLILFAKKQPDNEYAIYQWLDGQRIFGSKEVTFLGEGVERVVHHVLRTADHTPADRGPPPCGPRTTPYGPRTTP